MSFSKWTQIVLTVVIVLCSRLVFAQVNIIIHSSNKTSLTEKEIRNLYLGILRMKQVELTDQAVGQPSRHIFYDKFLLKTESQLKQLWSILIFSGERAPTLLADDKAVFEYVKTHPNSLGYVSSDFYKREQGKGSEPDPAVVFVIQ